MILYFDSGEPEAKPLGVIHLVPGTEILDGNDCQQQKVWPKQAPVWPSGAAIDNRLCVATSRRTYFFHFEDASLCKAWTGILRDAVSGKSRHTYLEPLPAPRPAPAADLLPNETSNTQAQPGAVAAEDDSILPAAVTSALTRLASFLGKRKGGEPMVCTSTPATVGTDAAVVAPASAAGSEPGSSVRAQQYAQWVAEFRRRKGLADYSPDFTELPYHEVIVVGAGVAGLGAAWTLRHQYNLDGAFWLVQP